VKTIRLLFVLALLVGGLCVIRLAISYQGFQDQIFVDFPRGTTTSDMAGELANAGVVRSRWDFLLARLMDRGRVLQAGEYRFDRPATPAEVIDRIARGDVFYYELVIPEGKNMFDIAALVEPLGIFKAAEFLAAARKPETIRDLDPQAASLEGYLFPDTYKLSRHTTADGLCRTMTAKFRDAWQSLHANAGIHNIVTLASLVEKEGKLAAERPKIAGVFANRLRIGMKLDCDPTTVYAALLDARYRGVIHRSDLDSDNPYNTYRHVGLPPGPIANPGLASIRAALNPDELSALYFVARPDGSGGHQFSNDIAAHESAVEKYRHARRQ